MYFISGMHSKDLLLAVLSPHVFDAIMTTFLSDFVYDYIKIALLVKCTVNFNWILLTLPHSYRQEEAVMDFCVQCSYFYFLNAFEKLADVKRKDRRTEAAHIVDSY